MLTAEQVAAFDAQFHEYKDLPAHISGVQAEQRWWVYKLPHPVLQEVWRLADVSRDGLLDVCEHRVALHLIRWVLAGNNLPSAVPQELLRAACVPHGAQGARVQAAAPLPLPPVRGPGAPDRGRPVHGGPGQYNTVLQGGPGLEPSQRPTLASSAAVSGPAKRARDPAEGEPREAGEPRRPRQEASDCGWSIDPRPVEKPKPKPGQAPEGLQTADGSAQSKSVLNEIVQRRKWRTVFTRAHRGEEHAKEFQVTVSLWRQPDRAAEPPCTFVGEWMPAVKRAEASAAAAALAALDGESVGARRDLMRPPASSHGPNGVERVQQSRLRYLLLQQRSGASLLAMHEKHGWQMTAMHLSCVWAMLNRLQREGGHGLDADDRGLHALLRDSTASVETLRPLSPDNPARTVSNIAHAVCSSLVVRGLSRRSHDLASGVTALFDACEAAALPLMGEFNPQELSNLIWTFAKAEHDAVALFEAAALAAVRMVDGAAWSTPNALVPDELAISQEGREPAAERRVHMHAQELSNLLWAYGKAAVSSPALFGAAASACDATVGGLTGWDVQSLCNLLWAFAAADARHASLIAAGEAALCENVARDTFFEQVHLTQVPSWPATWRLHGGCMAAAWRLHGGCMAATWRLHGGCMAAAWRLHGGNNAATTRLP